MLKQESKPQPSTVPYATITEIHQTRRIIVPITESDFDLTDTSHRIWELAHATGASVKFIGLCKNSIQEPSLRRALVTVSAMVHNGSIATETAIVLGRDWVEGVKEHLQTGDMVVCWDGYADNPVGKPLSEIFLSELNVPIFFLSKDSQTRIAQPGWLSRISAWIGFVVIIFSFFILQVNIQRFAGTWTIALELLSITIEFWLIWTWHKLLG